MSTFDPADVFIEIVKKYDGCSLKNRKEELAALVARGVDDPKMSVLIKTNCGMFALGVFKEAGVNHPLLSTKYKNGMAIAWCRTVGIDLKALNRFSYISTKRVLPKRGALLHYYNPGKNNNHVEFLLSDIDAKGFADHGGGGRTDNAISISNSYIYSSSGRPLQEWLDPDLLLPVDSGV